MAISKSKKVKPLTNKKDIQEWVEWAFNTRCFTINDNLTVDFFCPVYLQRAVHELPIQIGKIEGHFSCNGCELKSFKGFPRIIQGFLEARQNKLTNFDYFPEVIEGSIDLYENQLTKVYNLPKVINDGLNLNSNKITSLEGFPELINGTLRIMSNNLTNLKGSLKKVNGQLYCDNNKITSLEGMPEVTGDFSAQENCLISLKGISQSIQGFVALGQNQLTSLAYLPSPIQALHAYRNNLSQVDELNNIKIKKIISLNKNKITSIKNLHLNCETFDVSDNPLENLVAPSLIVDTFKAYNVANVDLTPSLPIVKNKLALSAVKNFTIFKNTSAQSIFIDDTKSLEEIIEPIIDFFSNLEKDQKVALIITNNKTSDLKKKVIFDANQDNFKEEELVKTFLEKQALTNSLDKSLLMSDDKKSQIKKIKQKI